MKRVVFFMLAFLVVSISIYGDIGKGDWTQDEINYFKTKEYKGNCTMYNFARKWVPPYVLPDLTESKFDGYGLTYAECVSKLILIGKLDKETEFRYLSLLRNEIYARNGYKFKNKRLQAFFNQMPWYKPISEDVQLNVYEKWNIKQIKRIEKGVKAIVSIKEPNPDTLPEKYIKKVIINAKWGKKEGEFAFAGEDPMHGPEPMITDKEGNIYISDQGNKRIVKYNNKGKLMMNYYYFKDEKPEDAKWGIGGDIIGIRDSILYTDLGICAGKNYIISININTGDIINKVHYDSIRYNKELENIIFYGVGTEYIIDETGEFKRTDMEKRNIYLNPTVQNIIEKNYPIKLGKLIGMISYIGSDSLKNRYYEASPAIINGKSILRHIYIYKFSEQNDLLAYIKTSVDNYVESLIRIGAGGDIYLLNETAIFKCIDNRGPGTYKFISGKIQLIKWELQK